MKQKIILALSILFGLTLLISQACADQAKRYIVRDGEPMSAIVYARKDRSMATAQEKQAAEQLRHIIKRASGVQLPLLRDGGDINDLPEGHSVIMIGGGAIANWRGLPISQINPGAYRIVSKTIKDHHGTRQYLFLQGRDTLTTTSKLKVDRGWVPKYNDASLWAVGYFLDRFMGVRWLWPGEVGTYVPEAKTIEMPADMSVVKQPKLVFRGLRNSLALVQDNPPVSDAKTMAKISKEAKLWLNYHQMGSRSSYHFGHAFGSWWKKYHQTYPDVFAKLPEGKKQPYPRSGRVKLRLSNEKVDELIIKEWKAAGKPDVWNVCPNDGRGWDVSKATMEMDKPARYDSWKEFWGAPPPGNLLSARYVRFWSRLLKKMRKLNPDVELASYAYSAYRGPPPEQVNMPDDGLVLQVVPAYRGYGEKTRRRWAGWSERGAKLQLRPNWFHTGSTAPYLPLHAMGGYLRFARSHGMLGYNFDSLLGYWGTQGLLYYMVPRLMNRPDLSVDEVIDEYVEAFGKAGPAVRQYVAYWESISNKAPFKSTKNGFVALPRVVKDSYIKKSWQILDRARKLASGDEEMVQKRVKFLRDGLRQMELTRKVMKLGNINTRPKDTTKAQFARLTDKLWNLRRDLSARNVVWGDVLAWEDNRYKLPTSVKRAEADTYLTGPFKPQSAESADQSQIDASFADWRFKKDPNEQGVKDKWYQKPGVDKSWRKIDVAVPWNYTWVGDYHDRGWYQTQFKIPEKYKGQTITLHFAGVDSEGWVYVNGKLVGEKSTQSTGKPVGDIWDKPITAKLPADQLYWGDKPNTLYVRVTTPAGQGGIYGPVTVLKGDE